MKSSANDTFKLNNFDLVRLLAAMQVAVHHAMSHLAVHEGWLASVMKIFPGVPIFFFVSGLLISKSYETNSKLREYSLNRVLRIYPALIVCTLLAVISVWATGYFATQEFSAIHFVAWVVGQMTFFQFYPPEFMRDFGSGVLNGSLWTVTVELQFYALVPVVYMVLRKACRTLAQENWALLLMMAAFLAINVIFHPVNDEQGGRVAIKLMKASFIPWFYMFLLGVLVQKNFELVHRWLAGRVIWIALAYAVASWAALAYATPVGGFVEGVPPGTYALRFGNEMNPLLYALLAALVFSFAYSAPWMANTLLRRNDISYGVYIYHIPIINVMMWYGYLHEARYVVVALVGTVVLAAVSWFAIERPAMRLKKHPLFAVSSNPAT